MCGAIKFRTQESAPFLGVSTNVSQLLREQRELRRTRGEKGWNTVSDLIRFRLVFL